jgi:fatty-acyl-CoA synthase
MTLGGRIVIMPRPDIGEFLCLIARYRVTHTFLPPTMINMLLDHPKLATSDLTSLQCFWYGGAPISSVRLAEAMKEDRTYGATRRANGSADGSLHDAATRPLQR